MTTAVMFCKLCERYIAVGDDTGPVALCPWCGSRYVCTKHIPEIDGTGVAEALRAKARELLNLANAIERKETTT